MQKIGEYIIVGKRVFGDPADLTRDGQVRSLFVRFPGWDSHEADFIGHLVYFRRFLSAAHAREWAEKWAKKKLEKRNSYA